MNLKQLKEQLIGVPDDAVVVLDERDGWFRECKAELTRAVDTGHGQFWNLEGGSEPRKAVLLFS